MPIEKINAVQQAVSTQNKDVVKETEVKTQPSFGSTKDIVATLGVLASIGIAAVAIIKSKNAKNELQEALRRAEEEKKKLAEEAKKATEDINKKVEEAVNKAKEDLKNSIPKSTDGKRASGGSERIIYIEREVPKSETVVEPKPETVVEPKPEAVVEPKPETVVEPKPETVVEPKPETVVEPKPEAVVEPKPETVVEPKPETVVEPKPETVVEPKPETVVEPKPETVVEPKPETVVETEEALTKKIQIENARQDYQSTDMAQVARNIINEKPAPQAIDVLGNIDFSKPLSRMTEKELLFEYKALENAVKNLPVENPAAQRFLAIKGELINKRAFRVTKDSIVKREGALDEYTKQGLEIIEKQETEAKKAAAESNTRNAEWVAEQNAKREREYEQMYLNAEQEAEYEDAFIDIVRKQAFANGAKELEGGNLDIMLDEVYPGYTKQLQESENGIIFVPRATKLSDGIQKVTDFVSEKLGKIRGLFGRKKPVKTQPEPKPFEPSAEGLAAWAEHLKNIRIEKGKQVKEQVAKQLRDNTDTIPVQEFIDSSIPRKHNKHYHNKLQREYDKMAQGVNTQGVNTQGVNAREAEVVKPEVVEVQKIEEVKSGAIRQPISKTQEPAVEIKDNVKVEPKPEVAEAPKVEPKAAENYATGAVKVVKDEYDGLNEVEKLLVERDGHLANEYGQNTKRIEEINEQLAAMGKANAKLEQTKANATRVSIAGYRAERQNWGKGLENAQESKAKYIQQLEAKGLKPIEATDKEIELQVEYVDKLSSSAIERSNGDIEWAEKYANEAQKCLEELKEMGKQPIDRTTEDMQTQFKLFQTKNSISNYTRWIKDCDEKIQKGIDKLKELLQTSSEVSKKK